MRTLFLLAVFLIALMAWASELRVGIVKGANIQTFTGEPGGRYAVQCPSIDGGTDQKVWYRPGCPARADGGITCVVDAGLGDIVLDFKSLDRPYPVDLAPTEDRIYFGTFPDYSPMFCTVARRNP